MKRIIQILTGVSIYLFPMSAQGFTIGGIVDQGPGDRCSAPDQVNYICILDEIFDANGMLESRIGLDARGIVRKSSARIIISGDIQNFTNVVQSYSKPATLDYGTMVDPLPAKGFIFASLDADLFNFDQQFPVATGFERVNVRSMATSFSSRALAQEIVLPGTIIIPQLHLEDYNIVPGELTSNDGVLTVTYDVTLGPRQVIKFNSTFEGGFQVPEPTSILSLLALGTLGAASTIKRK